MTDRLNLENRVVGAKEVKRALNSSKVEIVYIAKDAEEKVVSDIIEFCNDKHIQIVEVESMKKLGNACGIAINAATAALLK